MNTRRPLLFFIVLALGVALIVQGLHSQALQPNPPLNASERGKPANDALESAPPGIKVGVRVQVSVNQKSPFNPAKFEEGFLVEEVRGNWVRMKGEPWEGFSNKPKEISAWINFRLVEWYRIKD